MADAADSGFGGQNGQPYDSLFGTGRGSPLLSGHRRQAAPRSRTGGLAQQSLGVGYNPWWYDAPEIWDTVTVQGVALPGICKVSGTGPKRKLESNSPPGSDGARLRDRGYGEGLFTITVRIWTRQQFNDWEQANLFLIAQRGAQRVALDVVHPVLSNAGIRQAYFEFATLLEESHPRGVYQSVITMRQFKLPTAVPQRAVQANSTVQASFVQADALTAPANPATNDPSAAAAAPQMANIRHARATR
jgi:hypothetical protein